MLAHVATVTLSKFKAVGDVTEGLRGVQAVMVGDVGDGAV